MEVLSKILSLAAGLGILILYIYYFVLSQAPKKTEKDKKIVLLLTGVLMGPILYFHANAVQTAVLVSVWLIFVGYSISNRSLSKHAEKLLFLIGVAGYLFGMYIYS
ncbi:MAG: hypothetical protein ABW139_20915 [Candidatus Thiodiazotropha sp. DIVDIV]